VNGPARLPATAQSSSPFRVMVVDDSVVVRGLLVKALESDPRISVVARADNGQAALQALPRHDIEVVVLDIEMPVMDGLSALPKLLAIRPGLQVLMASTLTRRNADVTLRALSAGAADYVAKPSTGSLAGADGFRRELIEKVTGLAECARRGKGRARPVAAPIADRASVSARPVLRDAPIRTPEAIAIGASTGGPRALFRVLGDIRGLTMPIFLTQHMPATFTAILAEHITRATGWKAAEATDGEAVAPGRIYVAPGNYHLVVEGNASGRRVRLNQDPPENFCRPAVDPMFRSLAASYGSGLFAMILTGMGHDGLRGGKAVVDAGGALIAQDEATSVVWGMPGAVANAGICRAVLPIEEMGAYVRRVATEKRP
jgi:two-component system chemotaxis response regulator CheB